MRAARPKLRGGLGRKTYAVALTLVGLVGIGMAALLVRALAIGEFAGAGFLIGFAALFGWQVGGFIRRNRPVAYRFEHIPGTLLP
jgi:membrane protein CcdC involved in cytochrome C biogenesis